MFYRSVEEIIDEDSQLQWLLEQDYKIVSPSNVRDVFQAMMSWDGLIAFDTETTGLNFNFRHEDKVVGLVFSWKPGESWYVPLRHNAIQNVCSESELADFMRVYVKPVLQQKKICAFNASFDSKVMLEYGIMVNVVADVQILYHITLWHVMRDELSTPSLKALTDRFLGRKSLELEMFIRPSDYVRGKAKWVGNFADLDYESVRLYACADADNTLQLYQVLMERGVLDEFGANGIFRIENSFSKIVAYSEYFGIHFDGEGANYLEKEVDRKVEEYQTELFNIVGHSFNPNSTKQLAEVLYKELGYPCKKFTDTGAPSTSTQVIEDLAKNPNYPVAPILLELKKLATLRRNFLKVVMGSAAEGYLHPSINPLLETGRCSSTKPNIQGMPSFVKKYFTAREGYYTFNFDFSSVEYRILASMAGEKGLIEFFQSPIKDYHRRQASVIFGVPYAEVTPDMRKVAKPFNFALPYGKGDASFGADLFGSISEENTVKAAELRAKYFAGQPNVEKFFDEARMEAVQQGWVQTYFGRRRYLDPMRLGDGNYNKGIGKAKRAAGNHRIQGTAADLYKLGMIRLYQEVIKRGWFGKVLFTAMVHDETNIEVHNSIDPRELLKVVRECVIIPLEGWCPLYIGCGFGKSWGIAKSQDLSEGIQVLALETPYEWDGDIERWYEHCEKLRLKYFKDEVVGYLNTTTDSVLDPDMEDFIHKLGYSDVNALYDDPAMAQLIKGKKTFVNTSPKVEEKKEETYIDEGDYIQALTPDSTDPIKMLDEVGSYLLEYDDGSLELFVVADDAVLRFLHNTCVPYYEGCVIVGLSNPQQVDECYDESLCIPRECVLDLRRVADKARRGKFSS